MPHTVIMIGDSHTVGTVSGPPGLSFVELTTSMLGLEYEVIGAGAGGSSSLTWNPMTPCADTFFAGACMGSGSWYDEQVKLIVGTERTNPLLATVMLGTNDAIGFLVPVTPPADYMLNIVSLTETLIADGASLVMLLSAPPMPALGVEFDVAHARLLSYRDLLFDYCGSTSGVSCGPDAFTLLDRESDFSGEIHLNASGHAKLAGALHQSILSIPEPPILGLLGVGLFWLALLARVLFRARVTSSPKGLRRPN